MVDKLLFLGFNIGTEGIQFDYSKTKAITVWPVPKNFKELQSYRGLATFYRKFIRNFNLIVGNLVWGPEQQVNFDMLNDKLSSGPILALPNFNKLFEVEVDASGKRVGAVLSQEGKSVEYFSEKLSDSRQV